MWGILAGICAAGAVAEWVTGIHGDTIVCLVCAVGTGWYNYRVWMFKAKRLWFIVGGLLSSQCGLGGQLGAGDDAELGEDVGQVHLYPAGRDEQLAGDGLRAGQVAAGLAGRRGHVTS